MPLLGKIVVIKRNGNDGISFPLTASSCLFGRRKECDIRIQLPQVSKEHCKIEVNENKEAILTNLSAVNPTQLNGGCFQQPVLLKHGDVLTIIDRSFRFEYPLQSTPRKKRSRSPKDETLQVLHVQQVAEVELLRQQTPGSKSLHASDTAECEEKNATENKQCTEENISKALPIQLQTPKSSCRVQRSIKKQYGMSPFSELYENLKHEIKMDKSLQERNRSQQAAKEGSKSLLLEPSAQISSSSGVYDLGSLTKEKVGRSENKEVCKIEQGGISSELNQISGGGRATRKSFTKSPRSSVSKEMSRDAGGRSHLQNHKELRTANVSAGVEVTTKPSKGNAGNAGFPQQLCFIHCMDYVDNMKAYSCAVAVNGPAQTRNASEAEKYILSTPTSRRKSSQSHFPSPTQESSGMNPATAETPKTGRRVSLKRRSLSEISAETPREGCMCRNDNPEQLPLAENKCLKQRRNSKQRTPGTPGKVLKEASDQASLVNSQEGHCETPASLLSSKSPRRNDRQSKELFNKSVPSETLASEELASELASAGQKADSGRKRGRRRTSGLLTDKVLETNASEEHEDKTADKKDSGTKEELAMKEDGQKQDLEDASVMRPPRLSFRGRSSGSTTVLKDTEAGSEMSISGLLAEEESGKTKRNSWKRSGDQLLQPLGKRKRVSFGGHLSPELFDKSLPPNSPLKRGAIPARLSLPYGNSPRAVLKKAQGLKHFAVQELSEHSQKEKVSPSRKSPAASPPATPKLPPGSPAPYTKGRFSVSYITAPLPIAEEKDPLEEAMNTMEKNDAQVQTPLSSHINQDDKTFLTPTATKSRRSAKFPPKATPVKRRSGSVAVLSAQRKSGASSANLLVAKSWAEVVKLGVARPQSKAVRKRVRKGRRVKKRTQSPQTPVRTIKGHFSTGHAESPATIVVGRAYSTTVRTSGRVPKVVRNAVVKLNMNLDESFTGMPEMFQTPENRNGKHQVQKTDFIPTCNIVEVSDLQTPEESGEMLVSPLNNSDASEQKQDDPCICCFLGEEESPKSVFAAIATKTPEEQKATLGGSLTVDSLSAIPEQQASQAKSRRKRRTPQQKLAPAEVVSGIKQLLRTPKQRSEPVEDLSGVKELMKTPKQKLELVEALSGIKQLMRTPQQKPEAAEVLSGIKQLMRTPEQKPEPAEVLSGIKQLMKTPRQKPEAAEVLSGIKQLMKTPEQKLEAAEVLSGIKQLMKTPRQKPEPVEVLSGIKQLMKTPEQKAEAAEVLSGIKQLMKTPEQKAEAAEVLSGIKQLMKTPRQKPEPAEVLSGIKQLMKTPRQKPEPAEVLSGIKQLMKTPEQKLEPAEVLSGIKQLMRTPEQKPEAAEVLSGIKQLMKTPEQKAEAAEVLSGIKQLMKTPRQKPEPVEVLSGIKQLMRTPQQKPEPAEVLSGIKQLMKTPKQKPEPAEVLSGIKQLMKTPQQDLEPVLDEIAFKRLLKTPVQETEAVKDVAGVAVPKKTPKMKYQPVEDMTGVARIFRTPKVEIDPIVDEFGFRRLVKTPRQKYQPADDFVGLQKLLAEPRQKRSDVEVDYLGVKEMFDVPEKMKVTSVNAMDSQHEDTAPPCSNSSHRYEDKGNTSHGKDPQQKESTVEDQPTQRSTRGRSRRTVHPASAKQPEENLQELQGMEKKSTPEEIREISTSVAENKGRGRRTKRCIEEIISNQEKFETVSLVEPYGAAQRPGRGKRIEPKEVKHPSEKLQSCGKDSSVQQKGPVNTAQVLQVCDIERLGTEGDATVKTVIVPCGIQHENCQLQTGVKPPEDRSNEGGVEDSKEKFLSPWKRSGGAQEVEGTEPVIPPKRGRRARNVQVEQAAVEDLQGTRKLRKDPSARMVQGLEQAAEKSAATPGESGSGTKPEEKITEGRAKSLRSARKHLPEVKADICVIVLENMLNTQKTEEKSAKANTGTRPHLKSEIKVSLGDENAQENTTETSQRLKAVPSGETNKMPVAAVSLEVMNNAVQEPSRTRNRRGKKDSLEKQPAEFTKDANSLELITPKVKPEREMDETSPKHTLSSVSVMKDQDNPAGTSIPGEDSDSLPHSRPRRTRNEQGILKAKQTAVLQENQAQNNTSACRRGRGRKVHFELEEATSKVVSGESILPGDEKDGERETSENPTSQVRRSRRKQGDSIPQTACPTLVEKEALIAEHCKDKASEKEQDPATEAAPPSTQDNPRRQGKRGEVAAAPRASRSLSVRRCGLLEGGDEKTTVREDPALGSKTLQAKANASARGSRKIDLAVEAKSSSLQRKRGLSETDDKEESTNKEQMPLETVPCAEEKPLGRGRRKETAPASHTTNYISRRGKRGLPANNGREGAPEEDKGVPTQLRKNRRTGIALSSEAPNPTSTQGKQGLSKESGRKNDGEGRKLALENSTSQEKMDLPKRSSRQTVSSQAVSSTSLQGLPEGDKNETAEQQDNILLEAVPSAKENPSRVGRKKTSSKPEETTSASLRANPGLAKDRGQKKILKVSEDASLGKESSQGKPRQLRSQRKKEEFALEAERSNCNNSDLPGRGNALEAQAGCLASFGCAKNGPSGKEEANPVPQPPSTARRRRCPLPADDLASKKLKSETDENKTLEKAKKTRSKEERDKGAVRTTQTAGGMDRKTRSSTRTRK